MIDEQKIKNEYDRLKKQSVSRLLSFEKVILLEKAKQELIENYLSRIVRIDQKFDIETETGFDIDRLINVIKTNFGDLNFFDTSKDDEKLTIDMAFHFCITSLIYTKDKMKYKVTVFWDM